MFYKMNPLMLQALEPFLKEYNGTPGNCLWGLGRGRKWSGGGGISLNLFQMNDGTFDVYLHTCPNSDWLYNNSSPRWNKGSDGGVYFYGFTTPVEDNYEEFSLCINLFSVGITDPKTSKYTARASIGEPYPILPNWKLGGFKKWIDAPDNQKMLQCGGYKSIPWGGSPNQIIVLGDTVRNFWKKLWGFRNIDYSNYEMIWKTYNKYPEQFVIKPQKISDTVTLRQSSKGLFYSNGNFASSPFYWNTDSYVFMNIMDFDNFKNNDVMIGNDLRCIASSKRCYYINPLIRLNKNKPNEKPYYYSNWLAHPTRPGNRNSPCWLGVPNADRAKVGIDSRVGRIIDGVSYKQLPVDPVKLREYQGYKIWKEINEKQKDEPVRVLVSFNVNTLRYDGNEQAPGLTFNVKAPMDRTLL